MSKSIDIRVGSHATMITSYATPESNLLYLSVIGPLHNGAARELVQEYEDRRLGSTRRCVLDLTAADAVDSGGLAVLHRLALMTRVDSTDFGVVCANSPAETKILEAAQHYFVAVVDRPELTAPQAS